MILAPDSMLVNDPIARSLAPYAFQMPDVGGARWEALVLYEYLLGAVREGPTREDPEPH